MSGPGGFVESCASTEVRPPPLVVLPERGPFTFPAPFGTTGIRLTHPSDMGGQDALAPCGYSYWRNINAHRGEARLLVFLGVDKALGGGGPSLWAVDKATDAVEFLGPIFPGDHPLSNETGERWYWSATDPHILYACTLLRLYRVDVRTRQTEIAWDLDPFPAIPQRTDEVLWQFHTSHDGRVHSATVKAGEREGRPLLLGGESPSWEPLGGLTYREGTWAWFPKGDLDLPPGQRKKDRFDECQVDKSGRWLLIKENIDNADGEDNRIADLEHGGERAFLDRAGAAGHSDNGFGYMVAADNWYPLAHAIRLWPFDAAVQPQGLVVYYSPTWDVELDHIAHGNAWPGPPERQYAIGSGATRKAGPRANEIVAFSLDGSLRVLPLAPAMVNLDVGRGEHYDKLPKANVDTEGDYVVWTANPLGRRDAFIVKVPDLLR